MAIEYSDIPGMEQYPVAVIERAKLIEHKEVYTAVSQAITEIAEMDARNHTQLGEEILELLEPIVDKKNMLRNLGWGMYPIINEGHVFKALQRKPIENGSIRYAAKAVEFLDIQNQLLATSDEAKNDLEKGNSDLYAIDTKSPEAVEEAWENLYNLCQWEEEDEVETEVVNYFAVSRWLAEKLDARGERTQRVADLYVWACTHDQPLSETSVILDIAWEAERWYGKTA